MSTARGAQGLVVAWVVLSLLLLWPNVAPVAPDRSVPESRPASGVPGVVVARAMPGAELELERFAQTQGYRVLGRLAPLGILRLAVPPGEEQATVEALTRSPLVAWADRVHRERLTAVIPDDTYYTSFQWNLARIGLETAWNVTTGRPSIIVAVLDTGVDFHHPDLAPNLLSGYDFVHDDADASDDSSHGTAVAGIIGAIGNNGIGVAGVAWQVKILPVKVLDQQGEGSDDIVAQGIVYATDRGARIINISSSTVDDSKVLREAVTYANAKNVLIVAAAGNTGDRANLPNYPAAYDEVLAVGASDRSDKVPLFSQRQPYIGMVAPGVDIPSTAWVGAGLGPYALTTGTSAAAPQVSGVAALLLSVRPDLTNDQLRHILQDSAQDICPPGRDNASGFGRLDAVQALALVLGSPPPTVTPVPATEQTPTPSQTELPALPTLPVLAPAATPGASPSASPSAVSPSPSTWYFAEGSTQPPFDTWLALFNSTNRAVDVRITYMPTEGDNVVQQVRLPPDCRHSIHVNDVIPNAELSLRVDSNDTVLAERSMYFGHDGTDSIGASAPSRTWYLAEGSTAAPFDTWILLQNPGTRPANVSLQYMREDGSVVPQQLVIPPSSRKSVYVNQLFQAAGFSTFITSDVPIVAERAMYFDNAQGGHGTIAVAEPRRTWYFAEGQTRVGFDTWLLVQNPNPQPAKLTVTFYPEGGQPVVQGYTVGPRSRFSLYADPVLPNASFGAKVESDQPIVAERAVYFGQGRGGTDSSGVASPAKEWFLPEGSTAKPYHETLALLNPNARPAEVSLVFTRADGAPDESRHLTLPPTSRTTVDVNRIVADAEVATHVTADRSIVVERTTMFADGLGGTSAPGIPR